MYGVDDEDHRVLQFTGSGWLECTACAPDGHILRADRRGAWQRTLRPGTWQPLLEQPVSSVHTTVAISGDRSHWLIAASSETFIGEIGKAKARKVKTGWGARIGFGDRFFTSRDHVWSIDLDGKELPTGVGADDPPDHALFACGSRAFYLTGTSKLHRYQAGEWSAHDIAAAGAAIGLV